MKKSKTTADYRAIQAPGRFREYDVVGGSAPHRVKLNDFMGRGSCDCAQFGFRVSKNRLFGRVPDACIHIDKALEQEGSLPMFTPAP